MHRIAGLVEARCSFCEWKASRRTWRPVKRAMAEHMTERHANVKVVV